MQEWHRCLVRPEMSLGDAIRTMDESGLQIALVADETMTLKGILTDGDVRRAMLSRSSFEMPVVLVMNSRPKTAVGPIQRNAALSYLRDHQILHLPIVDRTGRLVGLETLHDDAGNPDDAWVVIMAGGFGRRLKPLTDKAPKPLLEIDGKPMLERIIESLALQGLTRLFISVNYMADMIKDYCGDGSKWGVRIEYLEEDEPRGTAGGLTLLPELPPKNLLVMNGDILTNIDYLALIDFHKQQRTPATMCVREKRIEIQYGVVQFEGPFVSNIVEKPFYSCFINAGIYVFDRRGLEKIPRDGFYDMPTLFRDLIDCGERPAVFPIREYWLDIGNPSDLELARRQARTVTAQRHVKDAPGIIAAMAANEQIALRTPAE